MNKPSFFTGRTRTKEEIVRTMKATQWYDQGGQGKLLYMGTPAYTAAYTMRKLHKASFTKIICATMHDDGTFALDASAMKRLCDEWIERNEKEKDFIPKMSSQMQKAIADFTVFISTRMNALSSLSEEQLKKVAYDYVLIVDNLWQPYLPIDGFDENWKQALDELLAKWYPKKLTDEEIEILLLPEELSYVQKEEEELLKIACNKSSASALKQLQAHQKKFFWYKNNYGHIEEMPLEHFEQRLQEFHNPKKELKEFLAKRESIKAQKKAIWEKHDFPMPVKKYITFLVTLSKWRDTRKKYTILGNYYLKQLIKEIGRRRGIDFKHFENLAYHEYIERVFTISKEEGEAIPAEGFILYQEGFQPFVAYGKEAKELKAVYERVIDQGTTEIKGLCACKGKIVGVVKVINKVEDFHKMEQGNILVSYNTRPEFVPIMKKAGAIITDEGGITSHAAIISRELNVPCIIGTKRATDLLKDSMTVEVNATEGWVKIVKY